nr:DUF4823 domain-containing protein [uncultured Holophaga sp.]
MKSIIAAIMTAVALGSISCSIPRSEPGGGHIQGMTVSPTEKVFIMSVRDGQEPGYPQAIGSGNALSSALGETLNAHGVVFTKPSSWAGDMDTAFQEAKAKGCGYVLSADITLWEDNATVLTANGDKLAISLNLFEVKSKNLVATGSFYRVATGITLLLGQTPQRFIKESANGALQKMYGWHDE